MGGDRRVEGQAQAPPEGLSPRGRPRSELIIGRHPILEALRAGRRVMRLLVAEASAGTLPDEIMRLAAERGVRIQQVPRERLDSLAEHHQRLIAEAAPYMYADLQGLLEGAAAPEAAAIILVLDAIQDPQNLGNLMRTALGMGVAGVVLPERRAVGVTSAVGRASAGAIEHLKIARVTNLTRTLHQLKDAGLWVVGLDAAGTEVYDEIDLTGPIALVVGAEGRGLSRLVAESCDIRVRVPMVGPLDSLNAAVAGSIVLSEVARQRRRRATNWVGGESGT